MRLFIASGIFHPEIGGPATYLHDLLPELLRRGHRVTALAFGDGGTTGYSYPVARIPRRPYLRRQLGYYRAAARLWPGHDVAYVHSLGLPLPARVRPRLGKIVGDQAWERAVARGWIPPTVDIVTFQGAGPRLLASLNKAIYRREARRLDGIIVPSEFLKGLITRWGVDPAKITVVYNALDPCLPTPPDTRAEARARLGLPEAPWLLTAARLIASKGVDHAIRAVARLPGVHLMVAGDGPARPALSALAQRLGVDARVRFLGIVPRDALGPLYRAADYTLLYSAFEGLSHVLLESLRLGTPVIASDGGGNPEVVRHGENGWLVPHPDGDALAAAIERALAPHEQARCAANTAAGLERFSWEQMVERTVRVLARLA